MWFWTLNNYSWGQTSNSSSLTNADSDTQRVILVNLGRGLQAQRFHLHQSAEVINRNWNINVKTFSFFFSFSPAYSWLLQINRKGMWPDKDWADFFQMVRASQDFYAYLGRCGFTLDSDADAVTEMELKIWEAAQTHCWFLRRRWKMSLDEIWSWNTQRQRGLCLCLWDLLKYSMAENEWEAIFDNLLVQDLLLFSVLYQSEMNEFVLV